MPDSLFSPAWPNLDTLRQIPADQWKTWYAGLGETLPVLMQDLGLTAESFDSGNLQATIGILTTAMTNGNAAYANAIAVNGGWTFNLLITQLTLVNEYNGYMILPILSAVTQVIMTKLTAGQQSNQAGANDQAAATSKMMNWFFPIFSLVICFGYSSAFALYWVTGNLVMMAQTLLINKLLDEREKKAKIAGEGMVK